MSAKNSVGARTQRLNKLLVSRIDDSNVGGNRTNALINRETLLDAFDALYNECNKDSLRKHNSNVSDFTQKCNYILNVIHLIFCWFICPQSIYFYFY